MFLKCTRERCMHSWNYNGKRTFSHDWVTCPRCYSKLRTGKARDNYLKHKKRRGVRN